MSATEKTNKSSIGGGGIALIIAVVIAALISAAFMSGADRSSVSSNDDQIRQEAIVKLQALATYVEKFANDNGKLPSNLSELVPRYINEVPQDPYSHAYKLVSNGPSRSFLMYLGKDGRIKGYATRDIDVVVTINKVGTQFAIARH